MPSIADALEELNDKAMTRKEQIYDAASEYGRIDESAELVDFIEGAMWAINNITHWMPLPAPPEHIADVSKKISSSEIPNNQKGGER